MIRLLRTGFSIFFFFFIMSHLWVSLWYGRRTWSCSYIKNLPWYFLYHIKSKYELYEVWSTL